MRKSQILLVCVGSLVCGRGPLQIQPLVALRIQGTSLWRASVEDVPRYYVSKVPGPHEIMHDDGDNKNSLALKHA